MRCAQLGIRRKSACALVGPGQQSWPRCDSFRALSTPRPRGSTPHRRESHLRRPRSPKPTWSRPSRGGWRLAAADLARAIVGQGFDLAGLVEVKPDLERVFLDLTRRASATETNAA